MGDIQIPKGLFDILPQLHQADASWQQSHLWNWVESTIRHVCRLYGFEEIRTPVFERTELFLRGVGETTDIVSKEMYTFQDKGQRSITLRPEGTAPAMRSFIENSLANQGPTHKLYYIGPMFRYERPQAGRYRQHHQFGVEAIGSSQPAQDVEAMDLLMEILRRLGVPQLSITLNSVGDPASRQRYRSALIDFLRPHQGQLSEDSQRRLEQNPLRVLDSKDPADQKIVTHAPSILDYLSPESAQHFDGVKTMLHALKVPYTINHRLVRGLDYYNGVVFEVVSGQLGAQNSVAGGGRYDGLIQQLGGPNLPSIGFGCGLERLIQTILKLNPNPPTRPHPRLFLIPLGEEAQAPAMELIQKLRRQEIPAQIDVSGKKLKIAMGIASQVGATYSLVLGSQELACGHALLKEMATGCTKEVALNDLAEALRA